MLHYVLVLYCDCVAPCRTMLHRAAPCCTVPHHVAPCYNVSHILIHLGFSITYTLAAAACHLDVINNIHLTTSFDHALKVRQHWSKADFVVVVLLSN